MALGPAAIDSYECREDHDKGAKELDREDGLGGTLPDIEALKSALLAAAQEEHVAEKSLEAAIKIAIHAKIAFLRAELTLDQAMGTATLPRTKAVNREIRYLAGNLNLTPLFARAPLNGSMRKRTLGL